MYGWNGPRPTCAFREMNILTSWQRLADCSTPIIKDVGWSQSGKRWGYTPWTREPHRQTGMGQVGGEQRCQRRHGVNSRKGV